MATASAIGSLTGDGVFHAKSVSDGNLLSGLSLNSSLELAKASTRHSYRVGDLVYTEGEDATGAYVIRQGKVKLVANSSDGKALILRIAGPGEIISLSAGLSQRTNDTSAGGRADDGQLHQDCEPVRIDGAPERFRFAPGTRTQ